jgi:hypothetical protein
MCSEIPPPLERSPASSPTRGPSPSFNVGTRDVICPPCLRLGKDCTYHAFQKNPTSTFGVTGNGDFCQNCTSMGGFCQQHQVQQERERQTVSQLPRVYGITMKGTPCKLCLSKGDYCKKHESQRRDFVDTIAPQVRVQASGGQDSVTTPSSVYGITVKGKPCKICIRRGRFCAWHEPQRQPSDTFLDQEILQSSSPQSSSIVVYYGMTVKGKPCKICIREGDYCHLHVDQKPMDESSTTATSPSPTRATPFAVTKKGTPCKLCVRKGGICHIHGATLNEDSTTTGISSRHQLRRLLSLLMLGAMFQYAIFVGVLEGRSVATLQDSVVGFYNGIRVDSILEQGLQTYQKLGLDSMVERGLEIKDAVLHNDWVQQASSLPLVQTWMDTVQGGSKNVDTGFDRSRFHQDLMDFVQSNGTSITYPVHNDLSNVELN